MFPFRQGVPTIVAKLAISRLLSPSTISIICVVSSFQFGSATSCIHPLQATIAAPQLQQLLSNISGPSSAILDRISPAMLQKSTPGKSETAMEILASAEHLESASSPSSGNPHETLLSSAASPNVIATPPEPSSINAILREHCRTRLYVNPILLTSIQLRLLTCEFVREELDADRPRHGDAKPRTQEKEARLRQTSESRQEEWRERVRTARELRRPAIASFKKACIQYLLGAHKIVPSK
jgi:hypothetical protein